MPGVGWAPAARSMWEISSSVSKAGLCRMPRLFGEWRAPMPHDRGQEVRFVIAGVASRNRASRWGRTETLLPVALDMLGCS